MKILFAIKALDDAKGGAERVLVDISSGLADRNHNVSILSFDKLGGISFYPLNNKVKRIPLGIGDTKCKATISSTILKMVAIRKVTLKMRPDVFIAFMHSTFIPASFALIGTGVPVIASEHIVSEHYKNRFLEYFLLHISSFFVNKITVLSETIMKTYTFFLRKKMVAIANPVRAAKKLANPSDKIDQRKVILNIGRLSRQKDQETLIRAFAILALDYPDWDVRIVGEGELNNKLINIINKNGLQERVLLVGTTSEIESEYQNAHVFALPSTYESFGLATAEAMAHGLPTIGFSNCPGTNELIVHQENGLLVESSENRVRNFAEGLKFLMDSPHLRVNLGINGRKYIQQFLPDSIVLNWEKLIYNTCSFPDK